MTAGPATTTAAEGAVGTKAQGAGVNQEKGQNQMTRENTVNVPREPTEAMLDNAACYERGDALKSIWSAMLSAAPLHEGDWSELERLAKEARDWKPIPDVAKTRVEEAAFGRADSDSRRMVDGAFRSAANPATILKLIASARSAPPPSVEVFGSSSLKGEDTHRDADGAVVAPETWESMAKWTAETFGPVSLERIATRANEEMQELLADPSDVTEAADVCIVLSRYPGIEEAINRKMAVNRGRQWKLNGDGSGYHVKPDTPVSDTAAGYEGSQSRSEPNPSVEVERLREALEKIASGYAGCDGFQDAQVIAAEALSRKQEPGVPTPGAWVEWSGGENPVPGRNAEVKLRSGDCFTGSDLSPDATWQHIWGEADIIAYRIVPTPGGEE